VLDLGWDAPAAGPAVSFYSIEVFDGTGRRLYGGITVDDETSLRRKRVALCNTHVDSGADRAALWAVSANSRSIPSDFGLATFDFQSCRDAGVPACQPQP
jgi:hypothetical protein